MDDVPKYRKKRDGRKKYLIEWRSIGIKWFQDWRIRKRYSSERDRNAALMALQEKDCGLFEYRKGE